MLTDNLTLALDHGPCKHDLHNIRSMKLCVRSLSYTSDGIRKNVHRFFPFTLNYLRTSRQNGEINNIGTPWCPFEIWTFHSISCIVVSRGSDSGKISFHTVTVID